MQTAIDNTGRFATGVAAILVALLGLAVLPVWIFLPVAEQSARVRWAMAAAVALVLCLAGFVLLEAARRAWLASHDHALRQLREGLESMADGVLLWDRDHRLLGWNERLFEHMPHLRGLLVPGIDSLRLAWLAVRAAHPEWDDVQQRDWVVRRSSQLEGPEGIEVLALTDGRQIEVTQRRTASSGFVLLYRDVTERERSLRAIEVSEARFRDAISSMGEGLALWDRDGRLLLWNRRYLEILPNVAPHARVGITLAEINRLAARTAYPHWSAAEITALVERRLQARREAGVPFELRFDDGRIVEIVDHRTSEGGHVSILRDVTQSRQAAAELAASEARFRDGIRSMADGFVMWDRDGRLVSWNERLVEMVPYFKGLADRGTDRGTVIRKAIELAQPSWTAEQRAAWAEQRLASIKDPAFKPPLLHLPNGRMIEMTDRPTSEGGSVTLYRDVTERERQAAALARALQAERDLNQQQRRFIAVASHEFRTPLAIIDGAAQRLLVRLAGADAEIVRRLHRIRAAVARMTGLTEVTLSSARLESGQLELRPLPFDVAALLRELGERQMAVTPDFAIEIAAPDVPLELEGDEQLLDQALTNLFSNAVKYSGESRRVAVSAAARDGTIAIAVRDFGVGIPAAELSQLFTRFFRASTAQRVAGTGIGLHFAREIVALHHGTIEVDSVVGAGSTFTVLLPRRFAGRPVAAGK